MNKNIDHIKCKKWINSIFYMINQTHQLNSAERKYIKSCFFIAIGNLELEALKKEVNYLDN